MYFPKEQAQEKFFRRGEKYISYYRESPTSNTGVKITETHVCFSITCQIFAAEKGRGTLARSPGASHLEDKQERIKQQIVCLKSNYYSATHIYYTQ